MNEDVYVFLVEAVPFAAATGRTPVSGAGTQLRLHRALVGSDETMCGRSRSDFSPPDDTNEAEGQDKCRGALGCWPES
jgi:hypothetical protein